MRRGADTTTRRISKENPATTAHANLAYVITFPSKFITQSLCIGLTLKRQKQHTFLRKLLLENFISLCTVYYKYLYFIRLPVDSENNLNISTLLCTQIMIVCNDIFGYILKCYPKIMYQFHTILPAERLTCALFLFKRNV